MNVWQIDFTLEGALGTPLRSNTLWGHLCWAVRHRDGEGALERWLTAQEREPLLLSDAFPRGWLPRPLLAPSPLAELPPAPTERLVRASRLKKLKRRAWLTAGDFAALQQGMSEARLLERWEACSKPDLEGTVTKRRARNSIDRRTGRTPDDGGLYFQDEVWYPGAGPHLWGFACAENLTASELEDLLNAVGRSGYGRDASTGRGRFRAAVREDSTGLFRHRGNRWMTLSRGTLSPGMRRPRYRLETHYGRLGGERAAAGSPFKHPLLLVASGSTFAGDGGPHGELLRGVHPTLEDVRENALHLCLPFTEVEP
ncbi:MAG: hypothetical protein AB1578_10490 [Thermodesulfobacteriota bacterium]